MTKRIGVGVVAAVSMAGGLLLVAGCSSAPGTEGGSELTAQTAEALQGPDPGGFSPCKLVGSDGVSYAAQPQFVVRLPDAEGAPYGFTDGYSLPFPTPWIFAPDGSCNPPQGVSCVNAPNVWNFENLINTRIPSYVSHQFKVRDVAVDGKGGYTILDHQWFYNGTEQMDAVAETEFLVNGAGQLGATQAATLQCVYVLQQNAAGNLFYTGYHADVAQSHDPINWPNAPH